MPWSFASFGYSSRLISGRVIDVSYYQKYRPEKIADLDLGSARESFLRMMAAGSISHAFLLIGPRGSGKTSSARILARVVNCEKNSPTSLEATKGDFAEPCGECEACVSIKNGSAVDVLEIDAASNRGIDDIRNIREKARLAPASLNQKVYIIDEVHQLTNDSFNALLKILEEPPKHVMFILCTTEAAKVPATIISRCVRINFSKANEEELVRALLRASVGEGLEIEEGALAALAKAVDGSFREAHKVLEQISMGTKKVTKEMIGKILESSETGVVSELLDLVRKGKQAEVITLIKKIEETGSNVERLVTEILVELRTTMEKAISLGQKTSTIDKKLMKKLVVIMPKIKSSPIAILPLELALLQSSAISDQRSGGGGSKKKAENPGVMLNSIQHRSEGKRLIPNQVRDDKIQGEKIQDDVVMSEVSFEQIVSGWSDLLGRIGPKNNSIAGLLRSAKPKEIHDKFLTIEVFYKFHKEQLEQEARRQVVEEEIKKLWGPISVKCVLGEKASRAIQKAPEHDNITAAVADSVVLKAAEEIFGV